MSKKLLLVSILPVLLIGVLSCSKVREALFPGVSVNLPPFQFSVPPIPLVLNNEASLGSFTMRLNLDSIIRANTSGAFGGGAVASVKVKQMVLSIPNADAANNLSNFETARLTFSSNINTTPAAVIPINIPDTFTTTATVVPENSPELKSYLTGNELTFSLFGKARRTTNKPLTFTVVVTLTAK